MAPGPAQTRIALLQRTARALPWAIAALYLAAALPALATAPQVNATALALGSALAAALVALSVIDLRRFRLPDRLTLPLAAAGLAAAALAGGLEAALLHGLAAVLGFLVLYGVDRIYLRVRGRHGLGLGDAKLFAAAGAWVGLDGLASVLLAASVLGLAGVAAATLAGRTFTATTALPFGPLLAAGLWLVWLYGPMI